MKIRTVWVRCYDCGRSSDRIGGCYVVERRGLFGWSAFLVDYDYGGRKQPEHFRTEAAAITAVRAALAPASPDRIVMQEINVRGAA